MRLPPIYFAVLSFYLLFLVSDTEIPFFNEESIFKEMWHLCLPWLLALWVGALSPAPCKGSASLGAQGETTKVSAGSTSAGGKWGKVPLILAAFKAHELFWVSFFRPGYLAGKEQGFWGDGLERSIGEQECFAWAGTAGASPPFANVPVVMLSIGGTYE